MHIYTYVRAIYHVLTLTYVYRIRRLIQLRTICLSKVSSVCSNARSWFTLSEVLSLSLSLSLSICLSLSLSLSLLTHSSLIHARRCWKMQVCVEWPALLHWCLQRGEWMTWSSVSEWISNRVCEGGDGGVREGGRMFYTPGSMFMGEWVIWVKFAICISSFIPHVSFAFLYKYVCVCV